MAEQTEIEVLRGTSKLGIALGTALMLGLSAFAFHGVVAQSDLTGSERVIGSVIGAMFGAFGLWTLASMPKLMARHTLVFDRTGLVYRAPARDGFELTWAELTRIGVGYATRSSRTNSSTLVRLDFAAADPAGFATRHPSLARRRAGDGYRVALGPNRYLIQPLDAALRRWAPGISVDAEDQGRATGFTYR